MIRDTDIRDGEMALDLAPPCDAALRFIGKIRTPWATRAECPRQGRPDGPECQIEVMEQFLPALEGIETCERLLILYWLHEARRDLVRQNPARRGRLFGTFALRSPVRPNPIGASTVNLVSIDGARLTVRGLDCVDGTPLLDIKPERCAFLDTQTKV